MLFSRTVIASTLAALASAQSNLPPITAGSTTIQGAQETTLVNDLASFLSSVVNQPAFSSNQQVVATAIPSDAIASLTAATDGGAAFISQLATSTPAWFTALPSNVVSYYNSIAAAESSIISKDLKGPAPTNAPNAAAVMAAGVGAAVGVVAMVL